MEYKLRINGYSNIVERSESMGSLPPNGFSFLPENFEEAESIDQFIYNNEITTIKKRLRKHEIFDNPLEGEDVEVKYRVQRSADVYLPTIFFGYHFVVSNPHVTSVIMGVLSNYATDILKGIPIRRSKKEKELSIRIVVENKEGINYKIDYEGSAEGLSKIDLVKTIREIKR